MFKLVKIELTKAFSSRYIWIGLACCMALIIGFGLFLSNDELFENTDEEQTALEEQYEKENDWKARLEIQMELNQSLEGYYSQDEIEVKNQVLQYKIDHDLKPNEHNTTWDFITYTFQMLNIALVLMAIWMASEVVISEYTNKTYKLLYTKSYARSQILMSKYIAISVLTMLTAVIMFVTAWIVGGVIFGFDGFAVKTAISLYGKVAPMSLLEESILYMIGALLKALVTMSFVFAVAIISKNQIITIIIGMVCALWGRVFAVKLLDKGLSFMKYSMFIHGDFNYYIDKPMSFDSSIGASCVVLLIHVVAFVLCATFVNKREDL